VSAHTSTRAFRHVIKCVHGCTHSLTEEFNKAAVAVGLVILLLKGALVELLEAESAHKVLWVKLLAHGCDATASDGLLAARAQRAAPLVVMRLAIRLALVVKETAIYEWREALPADKAFRVPEGVES